MDLLRVARDVASAADEIDRLGDDVDWEAHRHVAGRTAMLEIASQSASALRDALTAWVAWLTVVRVAQPAALRARAARRETRAVVRLERETSLTLDETVAALIASKSPNEARACFAALAEFAPLASTEHALRETRVEAFRRLGIDDVAERFCGVGESKLARSARQFLVETNDLARDLVKKKDALDRYPLDVDARLARGATEGWPSRLTWRSAAALLTGFEMRATMRADAPRALGAASFARALGAIGAAFQSIATTAEPFAERIAPLRARERRTGFVFASALAEPALFTRVLGLSRGKASDQARVLAIAFLLDARFRAMRVALRPNPSADREEITALGVGAPLPSPWPLARDEDLADVVALFSSLAIVDALRAREGDDWFRNPRAFGALRALATSSVALDDGAPAALARRFEGVLA